MQSRTASRNIAILTVLVSVAIVGLGVIVSAQIEDAAARARARATQASLRLVRDDAIRICRAVNITRATDNQAHLQTFRLYQFLLRVSRQHPAAHQHAKRRRVRRRGQRAKERAIRELRGGQVRASWTPLIDCTAPQKALRLLSLTPILFSRRLPPASALDPVNARRPDPVGSVS